MTENVLKEYVAEAFSKSYCVYQSDSKDWGSFTYAGKKAYEQIEGELRDFIENTFDIMKAQNGEDENKKVKYFSDSFAREDGNVIEAIHSLLEATKAGKQFGSLIFDTAKNFNESSLLFTSCEVEEKDQRSFCVMKTIDIPDQSINLFLGLLEANESKMSIQRKKYDDYSEYSRIKEQLIETNKTDMSCHFTFLDDKMTVFYIFKEDCFNQKHLVLEDKSKVKFNVLCSTEELEEKIGEIFQFKEKK